MSAPLQKVEADMAPPPLHCARASLHYPKFVGEAPHSGILELCGKRGVVFAMAAGKNGV